MSELYLSQYIFLFKAGELWYICFFLSHRNRMKQTLDEDTCEGINK